MNKNKLIGLNTSKIFGNSKNSSKGSNFDLDTDLSTLNSKLVDETINSHSNILDALISKTVICGSNLSTLHFSEEYNQRKNVKKKLDKQLADVRKLLHENYIILNQITNFCIIKTKHRQSIPPYGQKEQR